MSDPTLKKKRRGAPPGNNNALRHGFYSRFYTRRDKNDLDHHVTGEFIDEINTSRICTRNLFAMLKDTSQYSQQDVINIYRAIGKYLGQTANLARNRQIIYHRTPGLSEVIAELEQIEPDMEMLADTPLVGN